ncbi:MAG: NAD-glutamate dehydrogenase, partial [Gemmatimonadales bacterium]
MNTKMEDADYVSPPEPILKAIEVGVDPDQAVALKSFACEMLGRAPADFFVGRSDEHVARIVKDLFDLLEATGPDGISVRVRQRSELGPIGGVELIIGDRPFIVDTVRQYLISKGFEIRYQLHPVVVVDWDGRRRITRTRSWRAAGKRTSAMYTEFEGPLDETIAKTLEDDIRVCVEDLRLATDDFPAMLAKTDEIAAILRADARGNPDRATEINEVIAFLKWMRDGGFVFLGYREYDLNDGPDGRRYAAVKRGSGLGILRREEMSAAWEPIPIDELPVDIRGRALHGEVLLVSKANSESRVHRRARMDYIGIKKLDGAGQVIGERRFLGLFTWQAYAENAVNIPILRQKLRQILEGANVPEGSHDYKTIFALFNDMPLEELFLVGSDGLRKEILAVMGAEDAGDVRLVVTPDSVARGVNVMVILPKRNYTDEIRERLRREIADAFGGSVLSDHLSIGAGDTARLHFYISASPERVEHVDTDVLKQSVASIVRTWKQRLGDALRERHDAATVRRLASAYFDSFSAAYVATVDVETAVEDIERMEALRKSGTMQVALEDNADGEIFASDLRLFVKRGEMILADVMPVLENLGLRVIEADAMDVGEATIHRFVVQGPDFDRLERDEVGPRLAACLCAIGLGEADNDRYNQLVITAGLSWHEVAVLRAYSAYAFQIGAVTSRRAAPDALTNHPAVARILVDSFAVKFDPDIGTPREEAMSAADVRFKDSLQNVESIGDDLTLRRLYNLIEATVRTSYFANLKRSLPRLTLKFDCALVQQMPQPRPAREMFVHGPQIAGLHLRFGPVARGGLRWSERPDDFRTEVLGLVRTQQVKNTVIVP